MDRQTAAADLKARNAVLLERARVAVEEFVLVRERVSESLAHSRNLLAELGTRDRAGARLQRLREHRC